MNNLKNYIFGCSLLAAFYGGYHLKSIFDEAAISKQEKSVISKMETTDKINTKNTIQYESFINDNNSTTESLLKGVYKNESYFNAYTLPAGWLRYTDPEMYVPSTGGQPNAARSTDAELAREVKINGRLKACIVHVNSLIDNIHQIQAEYK